MSGCDRDEDIRIYVASKDPVPPARVAAAAAGRPIAWTLPGGWAEVPNQGGGGGAFGRFATIRVSDDPALVLTVNQVTSGALLPNLNRWEGQLGLAPSPAADAEKKVKVVEVERHAGHRIDLVGKDTQAAGEPPMRMLAVLLPEGDGAWSFLLKGTPEQVGAQEAAFDQFVASVSFPGHNHAPASPATPSTTQPGVAAASVATPPADADDKTYTLANVTVPAGWVEDPAPRAMRFRTYNVGVGNGQAGVIVTRLPREFGSLAANIDRWRGEVGLPPAAAADGAPPYGVMKVGGQPAARFEFAPPAAAPDAKRSVVAIVPKGANVWFFKLLGPAQTVTDQTGKFDAFLQSLEFGEAGE